MKVTIKVTSNFKKQAKPLLKKYPSLKEELLLLQESLQKNPEQGISLGHSAYKIRLKIKSKGKGKSGGARVITFIETDLISHFEKESKKVVVNLISIYDKSEIDTITDKEIKDLINSI